MSTTGYETGEESTVSQLIINHPLQQRLSQHLSELFLLPTVICSASRPYVSYDLRNDLDQIVVTSDHAVAFTNFLKDTICESSISPSS